MSGVVLRCPNCGTTQSALGECDACHEAKVRHFCTNHTPGQWLQTPSCPKCGAQFGKVATAPGTRPASDAHSATRPPTAAPLDRAAVPLAEPKRSPWRRKVLSGSADVRVAPAAPERAGLPKGWPDPLEDAPRVGRVPVATAHDVEIAPIRARRGGCFIPAMFVVAIILATVVLGGGSILPLLLSLLLSH